MKERLIPYSAQMVRAKRVGLKTQTRRLVTHPGLQELSYIVDCGDGWWGDEEGDFQARCPYGVPGDILVTREAWRTLATFDPCAPRDVPSGTPIWYEADGPAPKQFGRYRHARFMCRWMVRDRDEITSVRVERLQDLSEADAIAEGADAIEVGGEDSVSPSEWSHRCGFMELWGQINGPGSWDANPWVWVIEFRRVTP